MWLCVCVCFGPEHGLERAAGQEGEAAVRPDHSGRQRCQQLWRWIYLRGSDLDPAQRTPSAELRRAEHVLWLWLHRRLVLAPSPLLPCVHKHTRTVNQPARQMTVSHHFKTPASPCWPTPCVGAVKRGSSRCTARTLCHKEETPKDHLDPSFLIHMKNFF